MLECKLCHDEIKQRKIVIQDLMQKDFQELNQKGKQQMVKFKG